MFNFWSCLVFWFCRGRGRTLVLGAAGNWSSLLCTCFSYMMYGWAMRFHLPHSPPLSEKWWYFGFHLCYFRTVVKGKYSIIGIPGTPEWNTLRDLLEKAFYQLLKDMMRIEKKMKWEGRKEKHCEQRKDIMGQGRKISLKNTTKFSSKWKIMRDGVWQDSKVGSWWRTLKTLSY